MSFVAEGDRFCTVAVGTVCSPADCLCSSGEAGGWSSPSMNNPEAFEAERSRELEERLPRSPIPPHPE